MLLRLPLLLTTSVSVAETIGTSLVVVAVVLESSSPLETLDDGTNTSLVDEITEDVVVVVVVVVVRAEVDDWLPEVNFEEFVALIAEVMASVLEEMAGDGIAVAECLAVRGEE